MECFLCERSATNECARCGALYCDDHGDALCERCSDPDLALPSHGLYRGSLLALFAASLFVLWLLIRPPADEAGSASTNIAPVVGPATIVLGTEATPAPTPTDASTAAPDSTATPGTSTPTPTRTPTPMPTASPTPTAPPTPAATATSTPSPTPTSTPTPAATAPTPTSSPASGAFIEYTVEPGDSLVAIVRRFLPDGEAFDDFARRIIDLNDIDDGSRLTVGDVLQIPRE